MLPVLVKYDHRPPSKLLPSKIIVLKRSIDKPRRAARGTLSESNPEAIAFNWQRWAWINLTLFLLPTLAGVAAILCFGLSELGLSTRSPQNLARVLMYSWGCSGSTMVFIGK
jgi:hypothetical protein